jgi:hypothetical protein
MGFRKGNILSVVIPPAILRPASTKMYYYKIAADIKERRFIPLSGHHRLIAD